MIGRRPNTYVGRATVAADMCPRCHVRENREPWDLCDQCKTDERNEPMTRMTAHNPDDPAEVAAVQTPEGEPDGKLIDPASLPPVTPVGEPGPDDESSEDVVPAAPRDEMPEGWQPREQAEHVRPVSGPGPAYGPTVDAYGRPAGLASDARLVVTPDAPATGAVVDASASAVTSNAPIPAAGTAPAVVVEGPDAVK
jgi:hypothetical protein